MSAEPTARFPGGGPQLDAGHGGLGDNGKVLVAGARSVPCRLGTSIAAISARGGQERASGSGSPIAGPATTTLLWARTGSGRLLASWRSASSSQPSPGGSRGVASRLSACRVRPASSSGWATGASSGCARPVRVRPPGSRTSPRCGISTHWRAGSSGSGSGSTIRPTVQDYLACLDDDEQVHCSAIEWVEQARWHTGRAVLVGDAAHASSPMMGQGGSLAMEDALILAELLRDAQTVEQALARYARRRAPRVHWDRAWPSPKASTCRPRPATTCSVHAARRCSGIGMPRLPSKPERPPPRRPAPRGLHGFGQGNSQPYSPLR